jgi:hypothetical protein
MATLKQLELKRQGLVTQLERVRDRKEKALAQLLRVVPAVRKLEGQLGRLDNKITLEKAQRRLARQVPTRQEADLLTPPQLERRP